jgi:predicted ATPase
VQIVCTGNFLVCTMKRKSEDISNPINGIGFENFRRFEKFPMLEFGPITYTVGRNNAGKSTMVKALLLVMDYLHNQTSDTFSFDNKVLEDANIVTFGRARNSHSKIPNINFKLKLSNYLIEIIISGLDEKTKVKVDNFKLVDNESGYKLEIDYQTNQIQIQKNKIKIEKDINLYNERIKIDFELNSLKEEQTLYKTKASKEALKLADQINKLQNKLENFESNLDNNDEEFEFNLSYPIKFSKYDFLEEEDIFTEEFSFPEHDGVLHSEEMELAETGINYDEIFLNKYDMPQPKTEDNQLKELLSVFLYQNTITYKKYLEEREKVLDPSGLSEEYEDVIELYNQQNDIKNWIDEVVERINKQLFYYLGANPTKQSALFPLRDKNNPLAQAIHEFAQSGIKEGQKEWRFVKNWMKEFEVGEDFEITFYAGEAYQFYVKSGDKKNHLADKGMGSLQAMVLILRVATLIKENSNKHRNITIILEEPELNLHPALHSKLTEFFHYVYNYYGIKFIIETHSEYMIRKSQLISLEEDYISNQKINPNPFKVYYFHKEEGPYEMIYNKQGKFERDFGKGFYDEASKMSMEQIKLIRKSN